MVKNPPANAGDICLIPGSGRYPGVGKGNSFQYPCLKNSMDRGAWRATVHGAVKEFDTTERLSTAHFQSKSNEFMEVILCKPAHTPGLQERYFYQATH